DNTKVSDLQQAILFATEIPPSLQTRASCCHDNQIHHASDSLSMYIPMNNQSRLAIPRVRLL
ncbi:MAG TPA: hypothetical protein VGO47_15155, partial [Chlamydiales bacterium]|nr:hypothetical protein [Chlamydiales bacterium]